MRYFGGRDCMLNLRDEVDSTLFIILKYELFLELLPNRTKEKNSNCQLFHHFYQYIWLPPALVPTVAPDPDYDLLSHLNVTSHTNYHPTTPHPERTYTDRINRNDRRMNNQHEKDITPVGQVPRAAARGFGASQAYVGAGTSLLQPQRAPDLPTWT